MPNVDAVIRARGRGPSSRPRPRDRRTADALELQATGGSTSSALRASGLDPAFYLFAAGEGETLPWDLVDNGVSKDYFWKELARSAQERLSPHCPEIQGCIRCGVCVETPNPSYRLPEKWKDRETLPSTRSCGHPRPARSAGRSRP